MQRHRVGPYLMEQRREFCLPRDRSLYLVSYGTTRTVRREFPSVSAIYARPRCQATFYDFSGPNSSVSVEKPIGISERAAIRRYEAAAPIPGRHDRSAKSVSGSSIG